MQYILIQLYIFKLRIYLKYPRGLKKKKIANFKTHMVETINEERLKLSQKAFYERFGSPKMVADNYCKMRTPEESSQYRKEKLFKVFFLISILVLFLVVIITIVICGLTRPTVIIQPKIVEKVATLLVQRVIS